MLELIKEPLFIDTLPTASRTNLKSQILRRGAAVAAFSLMEGFLEQRLRELFDVLSNTKISFHNFGSELQEFMVVDALRGVNNRLQFMDKSDRQFHAMNYIKDIAAYDNQPPTYTALGFSPRGSNVYREDIERVIKAAGVKRPWRLLTSITQDIGIARLSLSDDYNNYLMRRNKSAHDGAFNLPYRDLEELLVGVATIAIAFDIAMSEIAGAYVKAQGEKDLAKRLSNLAFKYRFIDEGADGRWSEIVHPSMKTVKKYQTEEDAVNTAKSRTAKRFNIIRKGNGIPIELF